MINIRDLQTRQDISEVKLDDLESRTEELEEKLKEKTDENDVAVLTNETLKDKEYLTKAEFEKLKEQMEANNKANQVRMIKWVIGTGVSAIATISGIIRIFLG